MRLVKSPSKSHATVDNSNAKLGFRRNKTMEKRSPTGSGALSGNEVSRFSGRKQFLRSTKP